MKTKLLSGIMLLVLAFSACKKEEKTESVNDNNSSNGEKPATMSAKINGQNWTATGISAGLLINTQSGTRAVSINGYSSDNLIIPAFEETGKGEVLTRGSYDFTGLNKHSIFEYATILPNGTKLTAHIPVSGIFTVTSTDATNKKISGTFSFQAVKAGTTDTLKVTNGVFTDVMYTVSKQ